MNVETLQKMVDEIRKEFGPPCLDNDRDQYADDDQPTSLTVGRCAVCAAYEVVDWLEYWIDIEENMT